MEKIKFIISYIDDFGEKHLAVAAEVWETVFYKNRFEQVVVSKVAN